VLLLAGDHIYKMDYRPLLRLHEESDADLTLGVHGVSPHDTRRYGIVTVDADRSVTRFDEKPRRATSSLASMGIYVFRKSFLAETLMSSKATDFGRDLLPKIVGSTRTMAYHFQGYWADVGTVQAYYEANMALLAETPALDLYDPEWVIHTQSAERPPVQIGAAARVEGNLLSDGCQIEGTVIRSVIAPGVFVAPGAVVRDSIILNNAWIGPDAIVDRCIVDKEVRVGEKAMLGSGEDNTPNRDAPDRMNTGLTLVGKRTHVPAGAQVGRNVTLRPRTSEEAFGADKIVASGRTL
jgi:glucose-1-phosphate adenylyltransferase